MEPRDEFYQYYPVPARLLRDEILDDDKAARTLDSTRGIPTVGDVDAYSWALNPEWPTMPWHQEGEYDHEVEVGEEWTIEDFTHNGRRGGCILSREDEPWTMLQQDRDWYWLVQGQLKSGEHPYRSCPGDVSGIASRVAVEDYCRSVSEWPEGLNVTALFALLHRRDYRAWSPGVGAPGGFGGLGVVHQLEALLSCLPRL